MNRKEMRTNEAIWRSTDHRDELASPALPSPLPSPLPGEKFFNRLVMPGFVLILAGMIYATAVGYF